MVYIEAIKEGFRLVNRVWPLVLVQLSMMFISGIGFFVFVGIPLAVAFILFSIDLTGITEKDIFQLLKKAFSSHAQFYYVGGYYPDCCCLCFWYIGWRSSSTCLFCEESGFDACPFSQPLFFSDPDIIFIDPLSWNPVNNHLWNCCAFH